MRSLPAQDLTTGAVQAHLTVVYGAQGSRQTISTITNVCCAPPRMTVWGPIPAIDGDDGRPVSEGFVGAATMTTNLPSRPRAQTAAAARRHGAEPDRCRPGPPVRPTGRIGCHTS